MPAAAQGIRTVTVGDVPIPVMTQVRHTPTVVVPQPAPRPEPAGDGDAVLWRYTASNDRRGHWLSVGAGTADVRTPFGPLPADAGSVWIEGFCREEEVPLELELVVAAHPDEPDTTRAISLRNLWWTLSGTTPPPRVDETVVRIGGATLGTAFVRPSVVYDWEPDYRARLAAAATAPELLRAREGAPLLVRGTGRTAIEARFRIPDGYRARLRQMLESCPPAAAAGR